MFESAHSLIRARRARPVRSHVAGGLAAVLGAAVLAAFAAVGCSDPDPVIPRAAIAAIMGAGQNPTQDCKLVPGSWLAIGDNAKPLNDGDSQNGASVRVQCAVVPAGDGFNVTASATLSGAAERSGSITINGKFTASGEQTNIEATFQKGDTGTFTQKDCTVIYDSPLQGVAAGRVWGQLTCPKATFSSQNRVCEGTAEFKFENCNQ